ncbi:hypothetical protein FI667_g3716, partial [Globisporangium splendens]
MQARTQSLRSHLEKLVRRDLRAGAPVVEDALRKRIDEYYLPIFQWTEALVDATHARVPPSGSSSTNAKTAPPCVCIGVSCVQGGGKTTLTNYLEEMFAFTGKRCAVLSLDDVYLERTKQLELAAANPENPLLQYRGNPGTQDVKFLMDFVHECKTSEDEIRVPRFDKSLFDGRGNRAPLSDWPKVQGPLDVLLIEGWCMGFQALESSASLSANLQPVNEALREFGQLYNELDGLLVIKVSNLDWVYKWREEPEAKLRAANKPALSQDQVRDFVDRFMPAYRTYLSALYATPDAKASSRLASIPRLVVEIDESRLPVGRFATQ